MKKFDPFFLQQLIKLFSFIPIMKLIIIGLILTISSSLWGMSKQFATIDVGLSSPEPIPDIRRTQ